VVVEVVDGVVATEGRAVGLVGGGGCLDGGGGCLEGGGGCLAGGDRPEQLNFLTYLSFGNFANCTWWCSRRSWWLG
jgi:hypothetical protein